MNTDDFIKKYKGKGVDFDGNGKFWCVDLARQYAQEVLGVKLSPPVTGAKDIWEKYNQDAFEQFNNTPTAVPQKGDIVIWNGRVGEGYGHIAVFIDGDVNTFNSLDQNWPTGSLTSIVNHKYSSVIGWLRKKTAPDALTECLKAHSDLMSQLEQKGKELQKAHKELSDTEMLLSDTEKELEYSNLRIQELEDEVANLQKDAKTAKSEINKLTERLEAEIAQRKKYRGLYDSLLKKTPDKLSFRELLSILWQKILEMGGK